MLNIIKRYKNYYLIIMLLLCFVMLFSTSLSFVYGEPVIEITGDVYLQETLEVSTTGIVGEVTYQWSSSSDGEEFVDIEGATNSTYTITENEINKYIKVTTTSSDLILSSKTDDVVKIAFYLDKSSVTISSSTYSGKDKNGNQITGTHNDDNKYVITQTDSNKANANKVTLSGVLNNCDITLDGINTTAKDSISIPASTGREKNVIISLKNTNNVNNVLYYTTEKYNEASPPRPKSTLKITSADGDNSINGVLNVKPFHNSNGTSSIRWGAGIGGYDNKDSVIGLLIAGGTFNVITDRADDCTAIGAGGNGYVEMKITGGKIYAENASTGATIGGGLGYDSPGGGGIVEITGGEIEAVNYGNNYGVEVWGVAIGGGGSRGGAARNTEVIISGGKIKATVPAGVTAIGAGNSTNSYGGKATINISGGEITASGNIGGGSIMGNNSNTNNGGSSTINISGGLISVNGNIGGGSATKGNGGESTVNIFSGFLSVNGNIGGGSTIQGNGGYSTVKVSGGTIVSNSIGGGYSSSKGYSTSNMTITGGSLNSQISSTPTNGTENVYLTPITFYNTDKYYSNSFVKSIGIDSYGMKDVKTDINGKAYFWLPDNIVITEGTDIDDNPYTGTVQSNNTGVLKYNTNISFHTVNMLEDPKYYDLYLDKELSNKYTGTIYKTVDSSLNFYVDKKTDSNGNNYHIDVYISDSNSIMRKIEPKSTNDNIDEYELIVSNDNIEVWFVVIDGDNKILKLDLNAGDIVLTKNSNTDNIDIAVGKYELLNFDGIFTLTSSGVSTTNILTLVSGTANVLISNLIAYGSRSVINVNNGTLIMKSDNYDNQITSTNAPAIFVDEEANIIMDDGNSLKINSMTNSAISGKGTIQLTKSSGAHLTLTKSASYSHITANKYTYITNSLSNSLLPYSLSLPNLIGYHNSVDNRLYDLNKTYTVSNFTTFKATSLTTTLTGNLTESHNIDANGNLVITLSSVPAALTLLRDGEMLESSNWLNGNVLTIPASEAYYNLSIVASEYLTYNYIANDYNEFYDGNAHGVKVDVTNVADVDVYYSRTMLDKNNYLTEGSTKSPELTDVGTLPVYYYIPQATYNENIYKEASGVLNIIINKADNRWNLALGIPNIVQGMTLHPYAKARWGEPTYTFYQYINNEYVITTPTIAGTYFVKAYVEGTDNYNALESNYVMFNIETTALVNIDKGRNLTKVTQGFKSSEVNPFEISKNGVLTAYIAFRYLPSTSYKINFDFSQDLPENTKITLIDFNSTTPIYYKYDVETAMSNITLDAFIKMGSTDIALNPPTSGGEIVVEYQLILDFSDTANNLSQLKMVINQGQIKVTGAEFYVAFSENNENNITLGNITDERGKMSVPISIKANDTYLKTLDITLTDENNNDIQILNGISVKLLSTDGSTYNGFIRKNHIYIALNQGIIDEEYTLILDNLITDTYRLNVKMYENNNSVSSFPITQEIVGKNQNSIYVKDLILSERFIDNNSTITFNVKYKTENEKEVLVYKSLKKDGTYDSKELVDSILVSSFSGDLSIPVTVNQTSGVWRYYFVIGDYTDVYNIIVK